MHVGGRQPDRRPEHGPQRRAEHSGQRRSVAESDAGRLRQGRSDACHGRHLHHRDGQPGLPALLPRERWRAKTPPWELGDPTNGNGFESAVGFAVADRLGFPKAEVTWVVVPFANSFAPGPKTFDIFLNQVSFKPERAQTADLSDGYYFGNQSLVALKSSPVAKVTSIAALKDFVFGAQVGTTSYDAITSVIAPSKDPLVFDTNDAAIEAVKNGTIDGVVVDLPTADLRDERPARGLGHRRPVRRRHPRALQRGPDQGQPADGVREHGHQVADRRWHARRPSPASGCPSRTPSPSSSPSRQPGSSRDPMARAGRSRFSGVDRRAIRSSLIALAQHGRRLRHPRRGSSSTAPVGRVSRRRSWTAEVFWDSLPELGRGVPGQRQLFLVAEVLVLVFGAGARHPSRPARAGLLPVPRAGHDLRRRLPGVPGLLVVFVLGFGIPALGLVGSQRPKFFWGDRRPDPRVHRVRVRGLPRRHRVGPSRARTRRLGRLACRASGRSATSSCRRPCAG